MSNHVTPSNSNLVDNRLFIRKAFESKWMHIVLIAYSIALFAIGYLATAHHHLIIGATNALYLSYGAFVGSAFLFIAEIMKIAMKCNFTPINLDKIKTDEEI